MQKIKLTFDPISLTNMAFTLNDLEICEFTVNMACGDYCNICFEIQEDTYAALECAIKLAVYNSYIIGKVYITINDGIESVLIK